MAKTTVTNLITKIARRCDYSSQTTDTGRTNLLVDFINEALHEVKQLFMDYGMYKSIMSQVTTFKTIANQEYRIIDKAVIVGNVATFTGTANDKIKVSVDGTDYDDIDVSSCTSIATVVTAINTAVGATVASADANTYLQIISQTTGSTSTVTIADGTNTGQTVIAELFSTAAERTASAIVDLDPNFSMIMTERVNDRKLFYITPDRYRELFTDPTSNSSNTPDYFTLMNDRFYFGPRPSAANLIYLDYVKLLTEVTSSSTMPFENKYDPVIIAKCVRLFKEWQDDTNVTAITLAQDKEDRLGRELILTQRET